jgi:hypothetical protein
MLAGKLTVSGNQLLEDGRPIVMHGINYFGFNNAQTMVDGLWAGGVVVAECRLGHCLFVQQLQQQQVARLCLPHCPSHTRCQELHPTKFGQIGFFRLHNTSGLQHSQAVQQLLCCNICRCWACRSCRASTSASVVFVMLSGQTSLTKDFSTQIYRQQLLGFNAVRLPFSFKDFNLPGRTDYNQCIQSSEQEIVKSVTPPGQC